MIFVLLWTFSFFFVTSKVIQLKKIGNIEGNDGTDINGIIPITNFRSDADGASITISIDQSTLPTWMDVELNVVVETAKLNFLSFGKEIIVNDGLAYIIDQYSLKILNVMNMTSLPVLAEVRDRQKFNRIVEQDGYAFISDLDDGWGIVNMTDVLNANFTCRNNSMRIGDIKVDKEKLYLSGDYLVGPKNSGLHILDLSNDLVSCKNNLVGHVGIPSPGRFSIMEVSFAVGTVRKSVVITDETEGGFVVINVNNPNEPIVKATESSGHIADIYCQYTYCYAMVTSDGIRIYNITDEENPIYVGGKTYGGQTSAKVEVHGYFAFICDEGEGLNILDVRLQKDMKDLPILISMLGVSLIEVYVWNNMIYGLTNDGLYISRFGSIKIKNTVPEDACDRAYLISAYIRDDDYSQEYRSDVPSEIQEFFYVNINCNSGPSIVNFLPNQIEINATDELSLLLPFSDFYGIHEPVIRNLSSSSTVTISWGNATGGLQSWLGPPILNTSLALTALTCDTSTFVFVQDRIVFFGENSCLGIVEISDQANGEVELVREKNKNVASITEIYVRDKYVFLIRGSSGVQIHQFHYDIFDLEFLDELPIQGVIDVLVNDEITLMYSLSSSEGLLIHDISGNISNPDHITTFYDATFTNDVFRIVFGAVRIGPDDLKLIFVGKTSGFIIIDVVDPSNPLNRGNVVRSGILAQVTDIFLHEDKYLFVIDNDGLEIYDVGFEIAGVIIEPLLLSRTIFNVESTEKVFVEGNYCFIAADEYGTIVFDIFDKINPIMISSPSVMPGIQKTAKSVDVVVEGGLVFQALGGHQDQVGLAVDQLKGIVISGQPNELDCGSGKIKDLVATDNSGTRKLPSMSINVFECSSNPQPNPSNPINPSEGSNDDNGLSLGEWIGIIGGTFGTMGILIILFLSCFCVVILLILILFFFLVCLICCCGSGSWMMFYRARKEKQFGELGRKLLIDENDAPRNPEIKINENMFEIKFKRIKLLNVLGAGGGGAIIYRAKWKGQIVCVKMFKRISLMEEKQENYDEFEREMGVMASISHPNILRFYGCTLQYPSIGIVMDFCENGDLQMCLLRKKIETIEESVRICREIACGMSYLHDRRIVHRDLKPQNVLLDRDFVVKIMDFGLSRSVSDTTMMTKSIGTCYFMAPELVLEDQYSLPIDIFAYSILMFIVLTKCLRPYGDNTGYRVEFKVAQDPEYRPKIDINKENEIKEAGYSWILDLMKKCWEASPDDRPSFQEIEELFDNELEKEKDPLDQDVMGEEKSNDDDVSKEDDYILSVE